MAGANIFVETVFPFSFLKDGVGVNNSFLRGGGWHEEESEFKSWNCIGINHNIWLRIMVTHGCCKRQTVQGEIHNIQQKCNFLTHGIEEI